MAAECNSEALTEDQQQFLDECEAEFSERYTPQDPEFVRVGEQPIVPPIVDPYFNRSRRNYDYSPRGGRRGGGRWQHQSGGSGGHHQGSGNGGYHRQHDYYGQHHQPY